MSALVIAALNDGEMCATTNIAINFIASATAGEVICTSRLERRTRRTALTAAR